MNECEHLSGQVGQGQVTLEEPSGSPGIGTILMWPAAVGHGIRQKLLSSCDLVEMEQSYQFTAAS